MTLRSAVIACAALACAVLAGPIRAASDIEPVPQTPKREQLTIAPAEAMKPWTGDLDAMIGRRAFES
jgi:hypothetical protein